MKLGILVYKTGKSFTKGEPRLQNRNFIYKMGTLHYKRDSRLTIYPSTFHTNKKLCVLKEYIDFLAILWQNVV